MESQAHKQQKFDSIVAQLIKLKMPDAELPGIIMPVTEAVKMVEGLGLKNTPLGEVCLTAKAIADLVGYNGTTRIRIGDFRSSTRHTSTLSEVPIVKAVESPRQAEKKLPTGTLKDRIMLTLSKAKKPISSSQLSERAGVEPNTIHKALWQMTRDGEVRRRKAKKAERANVQTRYLYEVAA